MATTANAGELYVKGGSYLKHHKEKSRGAWVEGFDNMAVGIEYIYDREPHTEQALGLTLAPKNSYGNLGATAHWTGRICTDTALRACTGVSAGIVYGYEPQTGFPIIPAALWTNKLQYKNIALEHNHLPSVGGLVGFDQFMLSYKLSF